ncbi:MAG: 50S ribosomal protein L23 [Thermoproteota archaeon]
MQSENVLLYPLVTEKTVKMIERENKLVFAIAPNASSGEVAREFERTFEVKVERVNVLRRPDGVKVAFIKLAEGYSASDISVKLRIL